MNAREELLARGAGRLNAQINVLKAQLAIAREALNDFVDKCVICEGTGYNDDAKQAWDVPGAPSPACDYCAKARDALKKMEEVG